MLKRSKTDEEIDLDKSSSGGGRMLVVNDDPDVCELVARLLERTGWPTDRLNDLGAVGAQIASANYLCVIIDSMTIGIEVAFKLLDEIRGGPASTRGVGVVILASTDTNRLFAYQSGADGFVVRPVHAEELLDVVRLVVARDSDERTEYRRAQLMGGATL